MLDDIEFLNDATRPEAPRLVGVTPAQREAGQHLVSRSVSADDKGVLFDFFEQCMIATTFSFQALEVFCNQTISWELKQPTKVMYRGKTTEMTPAEIERRLSTSEKLAGVLPRVKGVQTPKGQAIWQRYLKLQEARDATIHLKYKDQVPAASDALFFQFLSRRVADYPKTAADMIRHFAGDSPPRWLRQCDLQGWPPD